MIKKVKSALISMLILLLLTGCAQIFVQPTDTPFRLTLTAEQFDLETRMAMGPDAIWETQMAQYSQTEAVMVLTPSPTPTNKATITPPIPGSVKSVCLDLKQSYGEFSGPLPPSLELAQRLLELSGYEVIPPDQDCDARLEIELILWPVGEKYSSPGGSKTCYTGAKATGTVTLRQPGTQSFTIDLNQAVSHQGQFITIISECPSPTQAPVEGVVNRAILQALRGAVGVNVLFAAAKDQDESIRSSAIWDIYMLCYDGSILVPEQVFLDALADPSTSVRNSAIITLGQLDEKADFAFDAMVQVATNDLDADIRSTALSYLSWIRRDDPALFPIYRQALHDPYERVQADAIRGLGDLGPVAYDAIPDILAYFKDHPQKSYEIVSCLRDISGENLDYELSTWQAWWEEQEK